MANNVVRNWLFCLSKRGDSDVQIREVGDSSTDGRQARHRIGNRGHRQESGISEGGGKEFFPSPDYMNLKKIMRN